jgi:gliding motility-associated-like protein
LYELDTIWGIASTTYTYAVPFEEGPFSYSVAAFDSCETSSVPVTYQTSAKADVHTTMVSSSEVFMCEQEAVLSWTSYDGSTTDFYEIWSFSNGLWNLEEITEETVATIAVNGNQSYTVYINSIFIDGRNAFSSPTSFNVPVAGNPGYNYLKLVSVVDGNIELYQYIDESVGITEIIFQRRNYNGAYEEIGRENATADVVFFLDDDAETEFQAWQYRTKYIDSCGFEGEFSNEAKSIFLEGEANDYDYINTLNWSDYLGFDGGIQEYRLYRSINEVYDPTPIATFLPEDKSFVDDINGLGVQSKVCYRMEGVELFNTYNFSEVSASNELCLTYSSKIFIPNAFTPNGINPVFLPIVSHIKPETYHLTIINRWGQLVFESFDQNTGWDGTIPTNGKKAKNDVYVYIFEAEDDEGNFIQKKGFVSLIE